jgi:hypothetical protein
MTKCYIHVLVAFNIYNFHRKLTSPTRDNHYARQVASSCSKAFAERQTACLPLTPSIVKEEA